LGLRRPDGSLFGPGDLPMARSVLRGETLTDIPLRVTWPNGQQRDLVANSAPIHDIDEQASGSVTVFRDVTEQVRTEENLRRFSERLKILYDIDQAILAAQTPEAIFPPVLERLARLIPCCHAGILLNVPGADGLQLHLGDESGNYEVKDSVGLVVSDLDDHGARQVGDLKSVQFPSPVERLLRDRGLRAYAGASLVAGTKLLGFLFIGADEPHGLHPESMQIVGEVARSLALSIATASNWLLRCERRSSCCKRSITGSRTTCRSFPASWTWRLPASRIPSSSRRCRTAATGSRPWPSSTRGCTNLRT